MAEATGFPRHHCKGVLGTMQATFLAIIILATAGCDGLLGHNPSEAGTHVNVQGGAVSYGQTYTIRIKEAGLTVVQEGLAGYYTVEGDDKVIDATMVNTSENYHVGYWGIFDITDRDSATYHEHDAALAYAPFLTVSYEEQGSSIDLPPRGEFPFRIRLNSTGFAFPPSGLTIFQMDIGIPNKNDITPNPFIFSVRIEVTSGA